MNRDPYRVLREDAKDAKEFKFHRGPYRVLREDAEGAEVLYWRFK